MDYKEHGRSLQKRATLKSYGLPCGQRNKKHSCLEAQCGWLNDT
jgi:hypothetical protein